MGCQACLLVCKVIALTMRSFCQGQLTKDHTCSQNKQINKAQTPEVRFFKLNCLRGKCVLRSTVAVEMREASPRVLVYVG